MYSELSVCLEILCSVLFLILLSYLYIYLSQPNSKWVFWQLTRESLQEN